ncbi:MAG: hypothetical protein CBB68_11830 [Rhodospirillaceae bacterium TMED8]|nr:disulfide bond formation protein DsbA [Magnetovibrio sp.]OUT49520.1 MAG: hypothetical protein CBB68_11830 [Rhodospirillaceae bacterium TMED8]
MTPLSFDLFWSMRSPYSYLALDRLLEIRKRYEVEIHLRVVYPMAIRQPEFFTVGVMKHYIPYNRLDTQRWAEFLDVPFRRPIPDPIVQELSSGIVANDQPYIYRLTRVAELAIQNSRGMEFLDQVSRMMWDGKTDNWHDGDHLAKAIDRAGLDGQAMLLQAVSDAKKIDNAIGVHERAQEQAGHRGTPLMVFKGEPFFGQDRIDLLLWRLKQHGLVVRS